MRVVARVKRERGALRNGGRGGRVRSFTRRLCSATEAWMAVGQEAQLRVIQSSPRGTRGAALPSVYSPTWRLPPSSRSLRARRSAVAGAARRDEGVVTRDVGWREREDVSAGFPPPLMGMRYELFVGCSLAFSHCYATVLLASASPSCTTTKGINVSAHCRAAYTPRRARTLK